MFERTMRFESNLRYGSVDQILGLLLFYLIYLFSFFPRTSTAWDQAPQWGKRRRKYPKGQDKLATEATRRAIVPVHHSALVAPKFFLFHPVFCSPPPSPHPPPSTEPGPGSPRQEAIYPYFRLRAKGKLIETSDTS